MFKKGHCRICNSPAFFLFDEKRPFLVCKLCGLIFSYNLVSVEETEKHYKDQYLHEVDWHAEARSILEFLGIAKGPLRIFDYGSGSGRLSDALRSMGFHVDNYEPMIDGNFESRTYQNDYDLVILNQVIEHVEDILKSTENVFSLTRPGGIIFIATLMTDEMINDPENFQELFKSWWYKDDPTHISFFCTRSFEYICELKDRFKLQLIFTNSNGAILQRLIN